MEVVLTDPRWVTNIMNLTNQLRERNRRRNRRRWWMRPVFFRREEDGNRLLDNILAEKMDDTILNFLRMRWEDFFYLESLVKHRIHRMDTNMRLAITPRERLLITLRFLAAGETYASLQYLFRVSKSSISKVVPEVCDAIMEALHDYIKLPSSKEEWLDVSQRFEERWNFPHAIGAIDGKHIPIKAPKHSGSQYFNYKNFHSIVMLALVDADYNFLYVNVGGQGGVSDGGIFKNTRLHTMLETNQLDIPEPEVLQEPYAIRVPYFILGDKAFAFTEYCIRPYGGAYNTLGAIQRHFNYRQSRARMPVEDTFGIFANRFRVVKGPMQLAPEVAQKVVLTAVYFHNFLRKRMPRRAETHRNMAQHDMRRDSPLQSLQAVSSRTSDHLLVIRNHIANYLYLNGTM